MTTTTTTTPAVVSIGAPLRRQRWIDIVVAASGAAFVLHHHLVIGGVLVAAATIALAAGLVARRAAMQRPYALVPEDAASAHRELLAATGLPGIVGRDDVIKAADDALLEIAALLGGRTPRGGAQRRFVAARVVTMREIAGELRDRAEAWSAATAELEALTPEVPVVHDPVAGGRGVRALTLMLLPAFLAWDAAVGVVRSGVLFVDGVVLRVRAVLMLAARAAHAVVFSVARARRAWVDLRTSVKLATAEARGRAAAIRVRVRLRLRRFRDQRPYLRDG